MDFFQDSLAAPLTLTCPMLISCARGTPILAGRIGVARWVAGAVFLLLFLSFGMFWLVLLLVTRLGLMPCCADSKKKLPYFILPHSGRRF